MMNEFKKGLVYNFEKLGCSGLALKLKEVFSSSHVREAELMKVLTDATEEEILRLKELKASRLLKLANLHNAYANIESIEYKSERNLDKTLIERLSTCDYIRENANVIIYGAAGTGKTYIAKALGVQACKEGFRTKVMHLRAILRDLAEHEKDGKASFERRFRYFSNIPLLIIDEWFNISPNKNELVLLHELIDARYGRKSTIVCSQMNKNFWAKYTGNEALGEAITGRISSKSFVIELKGEDLRAYHYQRP